MTGTYSGKYLIFHLETLFKTNRSMNSQIILYQDQIFLLPEDEHATNI